MSGSAGPVHGARGLRWLAPGALVTLVVIADLGSGDEIVYGVLCAVPLLSVLSDRPRVVLGWGLVCFVLEVALGVVDNAYEGPAALQAQAVRLAFLALTIVLGMLLSERRLEADQHLRRVTDVARTAQATILRELPPQVGDWPIAVDYTAAAQEARVGGDLYDVMRTERGLLLLVGDVRGKGLSAVRLASLVLGTFRHPDSTRTDSGRVVGALDRTVEMHGTTRTSSRRWSLRCSWTGLPAVERRSPSTAAAPTGGGGTAGGVASQPAVGTGCGSRAGPHGVRGRGPAAALHRRPGRGPPPV